VISVLPTDTVVQNPGRFPWETFSHAADMAQKLVLHLHTSGHGGIYDGNVEVQYAVRSHYNMCVFITSHYLWGIPYLH